MTNISIVGNYLCYLHWRLFLLQRVKSLNVKDMDVVVEPGIGWMELNEYLEPYGLFFPLDPGEFPLIIIIRCF